MGLRTAVIHLANTRPELRKHLVPLLRQAAEGTSGELRLLDDRGNSTDSWAVDLPAKAADITEIAGWVDEPEDLQPGFSYVLVLVVNGKDTETVKVKDGGKVRSQLSAWNKRVKNKTASFDGFDFFEGENAPLPATSQAVHEIERKLGGPSQLLDPSRLIKPAGIGLLADPGIRYWDRKAWLVVTKAPNASGARQVGLKVQQNLMGKKALNASDPYLHQLPLYAVSQDGKWAELDPLPEKVKERTGPTLTEQKSKVVQQGEDFFGPGSIRITGKDGAYKLTVTPKKPEHKRLFRDTTVSGSTFEELEKHLTAAIDKVQKHLATR